MVGSINSRQTMLAREFWSVYVRVLNCFACNNIPMAENGAVSVWVSLK